MISFVEYAAVVTSALYGILRGARQEFDPVGVCCLAFVVAFGGGTIRDVLLDRHPVFWIANDRLPWLVFALAVCGAFVPHRIATLESVLWIPDAFGLGLFSVLGASYALDFGTSRFVAALLGVVTGAFGGVIADVICNKVPSLFRASPLYATCSFAGASTFVLLDAANTRESISIGTGIGIAVGLRFAALYWNLRLPFRSLSVAEQTVDPLS